jgi:hypothetical protein
MNVTRRKNRLSYVKVNGEVRAKTTETQRGEQMKIGSNRASGRNATK